MALKLLAIVEKHGLQMLARRLRLRQEAPRPKLSGSVALLGRAASPPCTTLLAEKLPDAIPAVQPIAIWL